MGREGKLAVGVLLLVVAGVVVFASGQAPPRPGVEPLIDPKVIAAVFGVPGLLLLVMGILPPRGKRAAMEFSAGRLLGGLGISLAGIVVVYLYYQVLHVMPRILLVGGMLAVPIGLLFAASCWTERAPATPRQRPGAARTNPRRGSGR